MVASATGLMDEAAGDATHEQAVLDAELDDRVEGRLAFCEEVVQLEIIIYLLLTVTFPSKNIIKPKLGKSVQPCLS